MTILIFLIAVILISAAIGLYFVNYALKKQDPSFEFPIPTDPKTLENMEKIRLHKEAWENNRTPQEWTQVSKDNLKLVANFYPNKDSHKYAIVVHGYTSCKEDMLQYGSYFYDWGFNVLAPDNRAHGKSEGKWIGMGWLDSQDHLGWINKIVEYDKDAQITMLGVSMGGATVMMTSGLELPPNVKCLIEDCGYSSVWDQFVFNLKQMFHLPPFPVLNISDLTAKLICHYGLKEASSVERLKKAKVPMLFIHGTADDFVPYCLLDKNTEAYKGPYKEVLRVENATHGEALRVDLDTYLKTVENFESKYIK